jgi:hypothetical protein
MNNDNNFTDETTEIEYLPTTNNENTNDSYDSLMSHLETLMKYTVFTIVFDYLKTVNPRLDENNRFIEYDNSYNIEDRLKKTAINIGFIDFSWCCNTISELGEDAAESILDYYSQVLDVIFDDEPFFELKKNYSFGVDNKRKQISQISESVVQCFSGYIRLTRESDAIKKNIMGMYYDFSKASGVSSDQLYKIARDTGVTFFLSYINPAYGLVNIVRTIFNSHEDDFRNQHIRKQFALELEKWLSILSDVAEAYKNNLNKYIDYIKEKTHEVIIDAPYQIITKLEQSGHNVNCIHGKLSKIAREIEPEINKLCELLGEPDDIGTNNNHQRITLTTLLD